MKTRRLKNFLIHEWQKVLIVPNVIFDGSTAFCGGVKKSFHFLFEISDPKEVNKSLCV